MTISKFKGDTFIVHDPKVETICLSFGWLMPLASQHLLLVFM